MADRRAIVAIITIGIVVAGAWSGKSILDLKRENESLRLEMAQLKSEQLQANRLGCAERAQKNFESLGISDSNMVDGVRGTFFDHYSVKYGRCLIQIETVTFSGDGTSTAESDLSDVDERSEFGSSFQSEGKLISCNLTPPDRPETACHSASEWSAYVKEMMTS